MIWKRGMYVRDITNTFYILKVTQSKVYNHFVGYKGPIDTAYTRRSKLDAMYERGSIAVVYPTFVGFKE